MDSKDTVRQAFFILLRAGLWNTPPQCHQFPLSDAQWQEVYYHARRQTVEAIIYDGICLLPHQCMPSSALLLKWTVLVDMIERRSKQMNRVIAQLSSMFTHHGIRAILLKGQGIASCYHTPEHRVCGDIDWFFLSRQDFDKALRLLEMRGIAIEHQAGFSIGYQCNGFDIEYHSRLLDIHNPLVASYLRDLQQREYYQLISCHIAGEQVTLPSPVLTHLIVNAHILKHMLAFGVGIRQLCDSARACSQFHVVEDGVLLQEAYRKIGLHRWVQLLNNLLIKELGMPFEYLPFPLSLSDDGTWMMEEMWQCGNFGFYDDRFGTADIERWKKRDHTCRHLLRSFLLHLRTVPAEACWFPVVHTYSYIFKK